MGIKKIVVIGPESTGKSTLSEALAAALDTIWVPEHARTYLDLLGRPYEEKDLLDIARGQLQSEDELAAKANEFLICDTDLYVLKVWSEHKYNRCSRRILEQIAVCRYDLYLLTYIDTDWTEDPQREHPEEHMRNYFYSQYRDIVINSGVRWIDLRGTEKQRMSIALQSIATLKT